VAKVEGVGSDANHFKIGLKLGDVQWLGSSCAFEARWERDKPAHATVTGGSACTMPELIWDTSSGTTFSVYEGANDGKSIYLWSKEDMQRLRTSCPSMPLGKKEQ
jgi:hypothetical protein